VTQKRLTKLKNDIFVAKVKTEDAINHAKAVSDLRRDQKLGPKKVTIKSA